MILNDWKINLIGLSFCLLSNSAYASMGQTGKVLNVSHSGRSFVINRGELSRVKVGDTAYFYYPKAQSGRMNPDQRILGKAQVVETRKSQSTWFFKQRGAAFDSLAKDQNILFGRVDEMISGREELEIYHDKIYSNEREKHNLEQLLKGGNVPISLELEKASEFYVHDFLDEEKELGEKKPKLSYWKELDAGNKKHIKALTKSEEKFLQTKTDRLQAQDKKNIEETTFLSFMEESDPEGITRTNSLHSLHTQRLRDKRDRKMASKEAKRMIDKNPYWSASLSDDELRAFYIKNGLEEEELRQKSDLDQPFAMHMGIFYGGSLTGHALESDDEYHGKGSEFGLYYELPLGRSGKWAAFDFRVSYLKVKQFYGLESTNTKASQSAWGIGLNWYLRDPSFTMNKILPYIGIGLQRGSGSLESSSLSQVYDYDLWTLPELTGGLSYRFKAGDTKEEWVPVSFGLFVSLHYEQINLNFNSSNQDNIETSYSTSNIKLLTGLAIFF